MKKDGRPSPIDVHVGLRIRLRRRLLGMSREPQLLKVTPEETDR